MLLAVQRIRSMAVLLVLAGGIGDARSERVRVVEQRSASAVPVWGLPGAPVTIDFFYTAQHNYQLLAVWTRLAKLSENHPHRLRIRHHLLSDTADNGLAETALEANAQGRFFELMDVVIKDPTLARTPTRRQELCERVGLDFDRVHRAVTDGHHAGALERARAFAYRRGVASPRGPSLLFNGRPTAEQAYQMTDDKLELAYDQAYEQALELLDRGVDPAQIYGRLLREIDLARPPVQVHLGPVDDNFQNRRRPPLRDPRPVRLGGLVASGHRRGPEDARTVVHFFCSMQSKLCASTGMQLEEVRRQLEEEVAVVFHDLYDNEDSNQPHAAVAHQLLRCAEEQGAYWEMWDAHTDRLGRQLHRAKMLDDPDIEEAARSIGIDPERTLACMKSGRHQAAGDRDVAAARIAGIKRTPSLVIGGVLYQGTLRADSLRALILEQLNPGLLEQWVPIDEDAP